MSDLRGSLATDVIRCKVAAVAQSVAGVLAFDSPALLTAVMAQRPSVCLAYPLAMQPQMIGLSHERQIFDGVICPVAVDVMHRESVRNRPVGLFPHDAVFPLSLVSAGVDANVAGWIKPFATTPRGRIRAGSRTSTARLGAVPAALLLDAKGSTKKGFAARLTDAFYAGILAGHRDQPLVAGRGRYSAARLHCAFPHSQANFTTERLAHCV